MTCQQSLNNIARRVIQPLASAMAGCTAMEHATLDKAHAEPSVLAARMSLNTRHFVAHETGVAGIFEYLATEARAPRRGPRSPRPTGRVVTPRDFLELQRDKCHRGHEDD